MNRRILSFAGMALFASSLAHAEVAGVPALLSQAMY